MSPELFGKIYHDITDPTIGSSEFREQFLVAVRGNDDSSATDMGASQGGDEGE